MIAVAHCQQHLRSVQIGILFFQCFKILGQSQVKFFRHFVGNQISGNMAAIFHQIQFIKLLQTTFDLLDRLNQLHFFIVAEHHNMGQFHSRAAAHSLPGRYPLQDSLLRCPDQGSGAMGKIIAFQIHHADQSGTNHSVLQSSLHIDVAIGKLLQHTLRQVTLHSAVNRCNFLLFIRGAQFRFRQDQMHGRRRILRKLPHPVPIGLIRCKLVAGDNGPSLHQLG